MFTALYPEFQWEEHKFESKNETFWSDRNNQLAFMERVKSALSIFITTFRECIGESVAIL
jgi:hypothetical protein